MKLTAEYLQSLAEAAAPVARELSVGLIQRPYPDRDGPLCDLQKLWCESMLTLEDAGGVLRDLCAELEDCVLEDVEDLMEDISGAALDLVDASQHIWGVHLSEQQEKSRLYLAAIVEAPVMELLDFLHQVMHAALDPWGVLSSPDAPELSVTLTFTSKAELERLRMLQQNCPEAVPFDLVG